MKVKSRRNFRRCLQRFTWESRWRL